MSDNNISSAAEARRKRFMKSKDQSGGSAEQLMKNLKSRPWRLFFDDDGIIQCFTQDPTIEPNADWKTHDFSQDQLEILIDNDIRKYHVVNDQKVDNVYSIELKPLQSVKLPDVDDFLSEVTDEHSKDYEVKCSIVKDQLTVTLSDAVKEDYSDVYPVSATRNGYRILRFYITRQHDPHVMYEYKHVSISDLLINESVTMKLGMNLEHCSIYTNKIFDKYLRA